MYQDPKLIKKEPYKTKLDDYDHAYVQEALALMNMQEATFVRQAILNEVGRFHDRNSIGREDKQQDFFNGRKRG